MKECNRIIITPHHTSMNSVKAAKNSIYPSMAFSLLVDYLMPHSKMFHLYRDVGEVPQTSTCARHSKQREFFTVLE